MTDSLIQEYAIAASQPQREADAPFLRRILLGLIAATIVCGAVTAALTSQHDLLPDSFDVASAQG